MDKEDKKQAEKFIFEGMIFADKLIAKATTQGQKDMGHSLYNAYYFLNQIYKEIMK